MSYQPNFTDPRVQKRISLALGFACGVMSESKSHSWSTRFIDRHFGQMTTDISKFLRKTLLIETNSHWNKDTKKCKEYRLNTEGVRFLREQLGLDKTSIYPIVYDHAKKEFGEQLKSGNFPYSDQSNRLWHPLQRYRKQYRTQILQDAGYTHDYDIKCCAPTLIHQYAQQMGMDEYLFALRQYLTNRNTVRSELALAIELEPKASKEIINALFCGATISHNPHSDIYHILKGDRARIEYLKQDPYITELVNDIRVCWNSITPSMSRRRNVRTNRLIKITCRQKWNVYFELERRVINSVRTYLDERSIRYFLIHDGWTCESEIDQDELRLYVREQTGFEVNFDYEFLASTFIPYCI